MCNIFNADVLSARIPRVKALPRVGLNISVIRRINLDGAGFGKDCVTHTEERFFFVAAACHEAITRKTSESGAL
jgi:hypothetical protein